MIESDPSGFPIADPGVHRDAGSDFNLFACYGIWMAMLRVVGPWSTGGHAGGTWRMRGEHLGNKLCR